MPRIHKSEEVDRAKERWKYQRAMVMVRLRRIAHSCLVAIIAVVSVLLLSVSLLGAMSQNGPEILVATAILVAVVLVTLKW